jgi:hypothetical protein
MVASLCLKLTALLPVLIVYLCTTSCARSQNVHINGTFGLPQLINSLPKEGTSIQAGLQVSYQLRQSRFYLLTGLRFQQLRLNYQESVVFDSIPILESSGNGIVDTLLIRQKETIFASTLGYIMLPFLLKTYIWNEQKRINPFFQVGVVARFLMYGKGTDRVENFFYRPPNRPPQVSTDDYILPFFSTFDLGLNLGFGLEIPIASRMYGYAGVEAEVGLLNQTAGEGRPDFRINTLAGHAGVGWYFSKQN